MTIFCAVFDFDMHSYLRFTLNYVHMKKICECQTLGKPHFGSFLENVFSTWQFLLIRTLKWWKEMVFLRNIRCISLGNEIAGYNGLPELYPQVSLMVTGNLCLAGLLFSAQSALHLWSCVETWEYGFPLWSCGKKPPTLCLFKGCFSSLLIALYNLFPFNATFSLY
jgi:hypothetical protein